MKISVVTSLYRSESDIPEFYARIKAELEKISDDHEILFVNDGSPDRSLDLALAFFEQDPKVSVLDLSRNFGLHRAVMTGLGYAKGELIFVIDSDLEEEPELLGIFFQALQETNSAMVYGVQTRRKGKWFEVFSGYLFYKFLSALSAVPLPANPVVARLMSRAYVQDLLQFREQEAYWGGLFILAGHKQTALPVVKHQRSPSTFTLSTKIHTALNAMISFSDRAVMGILYTGLTAMMSSILLLGWIAFAGPYTSTAFGLATVLLLGSAILVAVGVAGIYLSRILMEVKNRPYTLVRKLYRRESNTREKHFPFTAPATEPLPV